MIIVKLMGGIGNQMFQYSAGRRLAHFHKTDLKLDVSWFNDIAKIDTSRKYELSAFNIREQFASSEEMASFAEVSLLKRLGRLNRLLSAFSKRRYIRERHYHFDPAILHLPDNVYLDGYWQCERYFLDIKENIRNEFSFKVEPNAINRKVIEQIAGTQSVSIHVRRGDYVSNPITNDHHGTCSREYYQRAIEAITCRMKHPHYFVFSDEPDWVREHFTMIHPATFVNQNGADNAYEDMRLMSLCKHHIIANSSFSWWGAWLSDSKNKIIVAPAEWFRRKSVNTKDLLPEKWIKV